MKNQKGFTLVKMVLVFIFMALVIAWPINAYKLYNCDFDPDYKCEIIHGIGVIPMAAIFTMWFPSDAKE